MIHAIKRDFLNNQTLPNESVSRDSAVGIGTGYGLDGRGVGVRPGRGKIFLLSMSSRPVLGSTQPPSQ
jgi:hypothetical protein